MKNWLLGEKKCQGEIGVPKLVTTEMLAPAHQDKNGKCSIEY